MQQAFTIGGVLGEAYDIVRNNFWRVIGQCFLLNVVFVVLSALAGRDILLSLIVSTLFAFSLITFGLAYVEKKSFSLGDIFDTLTLKRFAYFFLAYMLFGLAVLGGLILLVIPGFIVLTHLFLVKYIAVREDVTPRQALKRSAHLTKGYRWKIFGFMLLALLINIAGTVCLLIGLLFTIPLTLIATTLVYTKLAEKAQSEGEAEAPAEVEIIEIMEAEPA